MADAPVCPQCNRPAAETRTKYGIRHDCCGLRSWGGKSLVDDGTHAARNAAHAAFDPLWKEGHMTRRQAYAWLSRQLGINPIHIADLNEATARRVASIATDALDAARIAKESDDIAIWEWLDKGEQP